MTSIDSGLTFTNGLQEFIGVLDLGLLSLQFGLQFLLLLRCIIFGTLYLLLRLSLDTLKFFFQLVSLGALLQPACTGRTWHELVPP